MCWLGRARAIDLLEQLRRARFKGTGRMAFLAQREAIARALAAGATKRAVWQLLHAEGHMPISYEQFVAYTRRYLEQADVPAPGERSLPRERPAGTREPLALEDTRPAQFRYPGKASDKDELI